MPGPVTRVPVADLRPPEARGAGMTHRGLVRSQNEDAILTDPDGALWAVADGMGGHGHGDVASDIVIDCLAAMPEAGGDGAGDAAGLLAGSLRAANDAVIRRQHEPGMGRMGATVVAMLIDRAVAHVAWAGDSRAYLLRGGRLRALTRDHTLVQDLVDQGALRPEDAEGHPQAHVVTRAVGGDKVLDLESLSVPLFRGDRLLLCSDGLTRVVFEGVVESLLSAAPTPEDACRSLVQAALDAGAPDNVSVIAVGIGETP
jgi:protein phosphatase